MQCAQRAGGAHWAGGCVARTERAGGAGGAHDRGDLHLRIPMELWQVPSLPDDGAVQFEREGVCSGARPILCRGRSTPAAGACGVSLPLAALTT